MTVTNVTLPVVSGSPVSGETLTTSDGTWTHDTPNTSLQYTYQWRRCDSGGASCVDITGATGPSLVLGAADVGHDIRSRVTATEVANPSQPGAPAPISGQGYSLVFEEDFASLDANSNGALSDGKRWGKLWYQANWPASAVFVSSGVLHLQSKASDGYPQLDVATRRVTPPAVSGGVVTDPAGGSTAFLYGYFEARMAFNTLSNAHWPAFWMQSLFESFSGTPGAPTLCQQAAPYTNGTNNELLTSELDVIEAGWPNSSGVNTWVGTLHYNTSNHCGINDQTRHSGWTPTQSGFHTYAAKWTPSDVTWYIDDTLYAGPFPVFASTFQPMFLILSSWRHTNIASPPSVLDTQVDWVRVWQDSSGKRWNA
jgi:glycosyl hydrolase family 16